jgi:hypothetical protein
VPDTNAAQTACESSPYGEVEDSYCHDWWRAANYVLTAKTGIDCRNEKSPDVIILPEPCFYYLDQEMTG